MKVAVLSDIHGNLPALRTVIADIDAWSPDLVVVGGDIINRGPRSGACLDVLVKRQAADGWRLLRGNHEDFVLDCADPARSLPGPGYETTRFAHYALGQVAHHAGLLRALPDVFERAAPNGDILRIVHASMRNNRDGVYPMTTDEELRRQIAPAPAVFVTGHTHRPLARTLDRTLVVNIGSVGASFDEDRRAAYGRFEASFASLMTTRKSSATMSSRASSPRAARWPKSCLSSYAWPTASSSVGPAAIRRRSWRG